MKFILSRGNYALPIQKQVVTLIVVLVFFSLALIAIHNEMQAYPVEAIIDSFNAIPASAISLAILATFISYIGIAFYDGLAMRYINKSLSWRKTAFISCCAHAISTTLGATALTSNAIRFRLYSSWGVNLKDVATIGIVSFLASIIGAFSIMALGFLLEATTFEALFNFPPLISIGVGIAILGANVIGVLIILRGPDSLSYKGIIFSRPSAQTLSLQWLASTLDWVAAAAVLYVLLPQGTELSLLTFIPIFVAAQYIGTATGLPGGIGVFEAIFLALMPSGDLATIAAALIIYRVIYYILPLIFSVVVLSFQQGFSLFPLVKSGHKRMTDAANLMAPMLYAVLTFITGGVMLVASAMPLFLPRIEYMARLIPEAIIEVSHLFASVVGTLLLIVSLGLWRRLHNAWLFSVLLFPAGALFTYLKGGDVISICVMIGLTLCLFTSHQAFYRRGKVSHLSLTPMRLTALLATLSLATWSGFYAYKNQAYSQELWWNFGLQADASRFLRASAIVAAIMLIYLVWRLLQPLGQSHKPEHCSEVMAKVKQILEQSNNSVSESNLALMGDKRFMFSASGQSFIMYGVKGRNWIALGEPIGLDSERRQLLLKFHETADHCGAWPCFYSIRSRNLHDFVDMGLSIQKIGEMALVPIKGYDLAGKTKARFRQARNRAAREGVSFKVIYAKEDSYEMECLESISLEWLRHHRGREKSFSLGCFDRKVLTTQPIAVAIKDNEIIAFSNLWGTPDKSELSLDLMRYTPDCMAGVMDYLFTEVMLWGGDQGYKYFSLGMAPMSGLDAKNFSSLMSRFGRLVYKYGGKFYSFQGLRAFKKKFNPDWEPIYLAAPNQAVMPRALGNLALLSAGGFSGLFK